ncbi:MAG: glycerophosphodiester phosphodiesterase [Acidimicrobiales bacterium]
MTGPAPRPLVIAHRGDWLEGDHPGPQNSVAAVLSALEAGADGAEVDARLSADGTVVLHHDAETGPADTEAGCAAPQGTPVCALADAALRHLGTLAELLSTLTEGNALPPAGARRARVVLNVELKDLPGEPGWDDRFVLAQRVAGLLHARHLSSLDVVVSSFDPASLHHFRGHAPATATALLLEERDDWRYHLDRAEGLSGINPEDAMAVPELFSAASSRGLAVVPWTVDSPDRALELAALGAAGLITNRPRALLAALNRTGTRGP